MMFRPSPNRWPVCIIALHWLMAVALLAMIGGGLAMTAAAEAAAETGNWEARILGLPIFEAYQLHKSVGVVLWVLVAVRLLLRVVSRTPDLPASLTPIEAFAARAVQAGLYVLMFAMPITGWLVASTSQLGLPTHLFGLFILPHAPIDPATWEPISAMLHWLGAWALVALASMHIAAGLKHQFIDKDDVMRAMLPRPAGSMRARKGAQ
tara:strand:+ start:6361 stop:6984 length:624 start_codon:yes stop_codon:yes gene_type:complete